ncbi:mechanosensitive ion channel domain-containing protein [Bacillus sp. FJAT-47783]|uniref:mechanosensitive ion channel family protein n=1 Tax=Bacillus sp. FJAT-47783 TaxID=2922712 RepID=UPI001FAE1413|nr:mechanosensitive ion channel domain-containing protein [Bacillus sp. FJAT-47783]
MEEWLKNPFIEITLAGIILIVVVQLVNKFVHNFFKKTDFIEERKEKTIESLIRSITKYVATIGFIFYFLSKFVEDLGSILAGAGIAGIVIGFGAQSLIRDILAGIFLIYEKQLHQGDFITINNTFNGTVEEIGLRSLKIREWNGKVLTISNGEIKQIQNYNIEKMRVIERAVVSFNENPDLVFSVLEKACQTLNEQLSHQLKKDSSGAIIEPFQIYGMTSLNAHFHGYEYTITGLVDDSFYFDAAKQTRKIVAQTLYDHHIKMAEERLLMTNDEKTNS